jgi:hypothetical protein
MSLPGESPASTSDLTALWRLVELCLPCHEVVGAATFQPAGAESLAADWERWVREIFGPVLRPSINVLQEAAARQDLPDLLRLDASLGAALPACAARESSAVGRRALLDFTPPQGAKLLERLRHAAAENPTAGQLATIFAVRAHVFHLPGVQVAQALLLAECILGSGSIGVTLPAPWVSELMELALRQLSAAPSLQVVAV